MLKHRCACGVHDTSRIDDLAHVLWNTREWHQREQARAEMHPAVIEAFKLAGPIDWHRVVLEWPHVADDKERLAYTQDEKKALADRQTVTTPGKYIKRHWPTLRDDQIRDLVYRATANGCVIWRTTEQIVNAVRLGPHSCMDKNWNHAHPYECYAPEYGWGVAVKLDDNENIVARALVYEDAEKEIACFVSTYGSGENELRAWLETQGYEDCSGWPEGAKLKLIRYGSAIVAPYIDGDVECADEVDGCLVLCYRGEHRLDDSGGLLGGEVCQDCNDRCDPDDMYMVGSYEDCRVCDSCINGYTRVTGRHGNEYYLHEDNSNIVCVGDEYYDARYLDHNNIVELRNGDYCHEDNAVCVDGDWYHSDDDDIVWFHDTQEHGRYTDGWQCYATDKWYSDDCNYVEVDGEKYHPDDAPESDDEDEDESEAVSEAVPEIDTFKQTGVLQDVPTPDPSGPLYLRVALFKGSTEAYWASQYSSDVRDLDVQNGFVRWITGWHTLKEAQEDFDFWPRVRAQVTEFTAQHYPEGALA